MTLIESVLAVLLVRTVECDGVGAPRAALVVAADAKLLTLAGEE